jgi:hypothetical protein
MHQACIVPKFALKPIAFQSPVKYLTSQHCRDFGDLVSEEAFQDVGSERGRVAIGCNALPEEHTGRSGPGVHTSNWSSVKSTI